MEGNEWCYNNTNSLAPAIVKVSECNEMQWKGMNSVTPVSSLTPMKVTSNENQQM